MAVLSGVIALSVVALSCAVSTASAAAIANSCATAQSGLKFVIQKSGTSATFNCPTTFANLNPQYTPGSQQVCTGIDCAQKVDLSTLLSDAALNEVDKGGQGKDYTLTVNTLPSTDQTLYFLCQNSPVVRGVRRLAEVPAGACGIQIIVKALPDVPVCSKKDQTLELQVGEANSTASFICGGDFSVKPDDVTKVLQGDNCDTEAELAALVPGASRAVTEENGVNKLSVTSLPSQQQKLCYKCEAYNNDVCKVVVTVAQTVTSTSTKSDAASVAAQAALGVLLAFAGLARTA
ncbi:SAG-related sequence SRS28 [Besnoitia besnoiti]|uniref:SAG-related sequence SRS28 n=1 Tax=Besnoitia besnoiti TaxID=94643 RepID=A0A2A9M5K9_BESBE|nr:SAG-related sequence SRS28 [Besnoitia besnoiti]PFH33245.1 SAG-related sequence SRS28 [Besnoitia besnoiti]